MISVIIPCYNSELFIKRAVESVLAQTYNEYEIILVDNGSTDTTKVILDDYAKTYPHKIKVLSEQKKGAPAARNRGLYKAKGEWLQFLDADDELMPHKLALQMEIAGQTESNIIVGGCYLSKSINGEIFRKNLDIESDAWKGLIKTGLGRTSSFLWRKKGVLEVSGWNENQTSSQEYELLFRMMKINDQISYCLVPQTIVYIRVESVHLSKDNGRMTEIVDNYIRLRLAIRDYLKSGNQLTGELSYMINVINYSRLIELRNMAPQYVKMGFKKFEIELPPSFFLKRYFRVAISKIKEIIKIRINTDWIAVPKNK